MKLHVKISFIAIIIIIIVSCSTDKDKLPFNINGGADRDNNYEDLGTFYDNFYSVSKINLADSLSGIMIPPLVIDGTSMFVTTTNGMIALIYDLNPQWQHQLNNNQIVITGMAADKDLNLYIISSDKEIQSYSHEGKLRWKYRDELFSNANIFDDLLAQKDGLVVSASNGVVIKLSFEGKKIWTYKHALTTLGSFCADANGNISICSTNNEFGKTDTLYFIGKDGDLKWKKSFDKMRFLKAPISHGQLIFLSTAYRMNETDLYMVMAIDTTGKEVWRKELNVMPRFLSSDNEGNVYAVASNSGYGESISGLYCFDKNGSIKWKLFLDYNLISPVLIGEKSMAVYGVKRNSRGVFFINQENGQYIKSVTLSDAPVLFSKPFIMHDPAVSFISAEKNLLVKIDESSINKILPW